MGDTVIRVENLGKKYSIRHNRSEKYATLRDTLAHQTHTLYQRLNPFRPKSNLGQPAPQEDFWALQDVSFEVNAGDRIGIIGRNGAGKSTLLKLLSRITEPSTGHIHLKGRVASLLEVGTGFHPELTGRENIFLNGAILGMGKTEIRRKFDEIVAFAEVEKFLDTPVKRYSSGMYVRLAFAVAAYLEPEILIVDEVLAVGDAAFQKKCLGKMEDVTEKEGRTILFVSHNMGMLRSLCQKCFLLVDGHLTASGETDSILEQYISAHSKNHQGIVEWAISEAPGNESIRLRTVKLVNESGEIQDSFSATQSIHIVIHYEILKILQGMRLVIQILTAEGTVAFASTDHATRTAETRPGLYETTCTIPSKLLNKVQYYVRISSCIPGVKVLIPGRDILSFSVVGMGHHGSYFPEKWPGLLAPELDWTTKEMHELFHTS